MPVGVRGSGAPRGATTCGSGRREAMMRAVTSRHHGSHRPLRWALACRRAALALLGALAAGLGAGCLATVRRTSIPSIRPPTSAQRALLQVPPEVGTRCRPDRGGHQARPRHERDHDRTAALLELGPARRRGARAPRAHGMSPQEVSVCVPRAATRVRDQGPPGGHTLLWEPIASGRTATGCASTRRAACRGRV